MGASGKGGYELALHGAQYGCDFRAMGWLNEPDPESLI